jgi:hypothetical protein
VPPGENRLVLAHGDYPTRTFGPFEVTAGVPKLAVQPQLTRGVTLRGRVTGVTDLAGKNLAVHIFDAKTIDTVLGADGSFEVHGVGPGRASLSFTAAKGLWYTLRVEVGDKDLTDLVFAVPAAGTGSVRATVVGLPRGHGSVAALGMAKGQCAIVRTFDYADAAFVVEALPPGRYEVEAFSLDGGHGRTEVTVGSGEVAVTVDIVRR